VLVPRDLQGDPIFAEPSLTAEDLLLGSLPAAFSGTTADMSIPDVDAPTFHRQQWPTSTHPLHEHQRRQYPTLLTFTVSWIE
jgi:hypothetical protein